ncbi:MAG TPA: branched-chain amino acid ABC transporter permease [Burkholderiales bacterium]|nr:branched-chain amino acid ABC transporter permease [Burkholderiales bacterium]
MDKRLRAIAVLLVSALLLLVGVPLLLSGWLLFLLTVASAKALAVLGIVLLLRGKLLTFGHALYYATGAYAAGMAVRYLGVHEALVLLALALVAGVAMGALLGLLVARYRAVYFALLNLAFSMVLYGMLLKLYNVTGGTDGIGIGEPTLAGFRLGGNALRIAMYELSVILTAVLVYFTHRFFVSPLGYTLRAIRDNEVRVEYMGVSVWRAVYVSYIIAGALGAVSGCLIALSVGHITPDLAFWSQSGEFVFVAILGGTGSVLAPVIGSVLFEAVRNYAFELSPYTWQMTLGIVLLLIIFFLPGGVWSLTAYLPRRSSR